jgi:hypothetical protein
MFWHHIMIATLLAGLVLASSHAYAQAGGGWLNVRPMNTLRSAGLVLLVLLVLLAPSLSHAQWSGEPAGSVPLSNWDMSNPAPMNGNGASYGNGWSVISGKTQAVSDCGDPVSPCGVLQYNFAGTQGGSSPGNHYFGVGGRREIFTAYSFYVSPGFKTHQGNKISFVMGNGWVNVPLLLRTGAPFGPWPLALYFTTAGSHINNCHMTPNIDADCAAGNMTLTANVTPRSITAGVWYRIQIYVKMSTCDTCKDGVIKLWLDDTLVIHQTTAIYPDDPIQQVELNPTWGSAGQVASGGFFRYGHVYVSAPNCPDGCPSTGDTNAPGGSGGGAGSTYKPRQVHTQYINKRPGEVAELNHKSKRNFFQIYGVPPICSLSAGTFNSTSQAWELTKDEMDTVKLTCPPEFCGSVSLTVLSLENKDSLAGQ